jgi:hypothetical protein
MAPLRSRELLKAQLQAIRIGPFVTSPGLKDRGAVEFLQAAAKHRAVNLVEQAPRDVHDAVGVDAEEVAVI